MSFSAATLTEAGQDWLVSWKEAWLASLKSAVSPGMKTRQSQSQRSGMAPLVAVMTASAAGVEAHGGRAGIFNGVVFHALMKQILLNGIDLARLAKEEARQIKHVDNLLDQLAAALGAIPPPPAMQRVAGIAGSHEGFTALQAMSGFQPWAASP